MLRSERAAVALYDTILVRLALEGPQGGVPTRTQLLAMRDEERAHLGIVFQLVNAFGLGGAGQFDPVVVHSRATVAECVGCLVACELANHARWEALTRRLETVGDSDLARRIAAVTQRELDHLLVARGWHYACTHARS